MAILARLIVIFFQHTKDMISLSFGFLYCSKEVNCHVTVVKYGSQIL